MFFCKDEIDEVVAVQKDGTAIASRLAQKVSYRRGLIIRCSTYHRDGIVLELSSTKDRDLLVEGFQKLLSELNQFAPALDKAGAIRKQLPRRKSVVEFFDPERRRLSSSSSYRLDETFPSEAPPSPVKETSRLASPVRKTSSTRTIGPPLEAPIPEDKTSDPDQDLERFYTTRFDAPQVAKPSDSRRKSVVRAASVPSQ